MTRAPDQREIGCRGRVSIEYAGAGRLAELRGLPALETHGGFDNDPLTMNHILRRVVGKKPKQEFTRDTLKY